MTRRRLSAGVLLSCLGIGLVVVAVVSMGVGSVPIPPTTIVSILAGRLGFAVGDHTVTQEAVVMSIRLPRVILGLAVGAGLGGAGAALQGVFRNPLADPQLIGVSSGAALGSAIATLTLGGLVGSIAGTAGAFAGAFAAAMLVYTLARSAGRTEVVTLLLCGIAVAAIAGAGAALLSVVLRDPRLGSPLFYSLGGLGGATWRVVWSTLPVVVVAVAALPTYARRLDLMLVGEREAFHMGVDVEQVRIGVLALSTLAVAGAVAAAGVIGFVGLLAPHAIRLVAGPGHRLLLPASALAGALLVVGADAAARTLAAPIEVPVGLITAVVGGPVFLWLLRRTRREHGGWG